MKWNYIKLEEIAEFRNGVNFTSDSFGVGIKVINVADFKDKMYLDYFDLGELDSHAKWAKECFLKENDIVFVRSNGNKDLIGRSIFIKGLPENLLVTFSAFCIRLRFKSLDDICPEFYLYIFKSPLFRSILSQFGNGTNISNLNQDILNKMSVPKPLLKIQNRIASILSTYDELMENNKRRIKILEEMAEEIYKEWFVRMRFPGYELTKFFDESGKADSHGTFGALPQGWKKVKLDEIVDNIRDVVVPDEKLWKSSKKYLPIDLIPRRSMYLPATEEIENAQSSLINFKKYDVLFGSMRAYFHKVIVAPLDGVTRATCFVLRPKKDYLFSFCYLTLFQESAVNYAAANSRGSTIPYAFWEGGLSKYEVLCPSDEIAIKFNDLIKPQIEFILGMHFENQLLQKTRDLLLSRLVSGKLSVEHLTGATESISIAADRTLTYETTK